MKKIILLSFILPLSITIQAQTQIENPGFEGAWETAPFTSEQEPIEWSSLKTADAYAIAAPVVAFKEMTAPHSGTYCIRLKATDTGLGPIAAGLLTNGRVHADIVAAEGYVFSNTTDSKWNTPFTVRPDSLVFWVKHTPVGGDKSKVEVLLHDDSDDGELPHDGTTSNWVGKARIEITATLTTWTRISVPFHYYNNNTPDYLLTVMSAGDSTIPVINTTMWIDDLALIYNPNLVSVTPPAAQNIDMGVNGTMLTVNTTPNKAVITPITQEWKFSTTSGGGYTSFGTPQTGTTYTPNFAAAGIYYVVCEVDFGTEVITSNEVEIVVTNPAVNTVTVSPSAPQTILANENGTLMTATESPAAASSREWKFSTTSGSGYTSFGTPVTGLAYTPNFAALDTYYVICESDFAGDIQISNEVTIIVAGFAGIDEPTMQFNIFNNGTGLSVLLSDIQTNTKLSLYSLDGKLVYDSALIEQNTLHNIDAKGIFVYYIVTGDKVITGKINL